MLQKIRDNSQGVAAKIFIGLIIAIFALFGIESLIGTFINPTNELKVNDTEISTYEIDSLAQRKMQEYLSNLGEDADFTNFDESLFRETAVNELIQRELLRQSAVNAGMSVSSAEIDRRIVLTPDFQVDGVFNEERANLLIQSMGFTSAGYRATITEETLLNQILSAYTSSGFVTASEFENLTALLHQKRSFRYVALSLDTQNVDFEISDEEIAAYYEANQANFQQEEQVRVSYIELNKEDMFDEISVTEEQVQAAYDAEVASYQAQTERRASHILLEASSEDEFTAAMAEAEAIKARISDGEDFSSLALEFSDDVGSAEDGGDVGFTTGDSFVEEFETALQTLELDQVSDPVRTEFGVHLIKLTNINETEIDPFEFRRDDLERDLKSREVETLFVARSEELGNLAFETVDLQEPASIMGLEIKETDFFGRTGGIGIAALTGVISASFSIDLLQDDLNSELIQLDSDRAVVLHILEHKQAEILPLEEVKGEVSLTLRLEKMREQSRMLGETIISSLNTGVVVDSLLEAQGLSWNVLSDIERSDQRLNPEISDKIFAMAPPEESANTIVGFPISTGEYIVVDLDSVSAGSAEDLVEGEAESISNFISQQNASIDFAGFMINMENRAEITGRVLEYDEFDEFSDL